MLKTTHPLPDGTLASAHWFGVLSRVQSKITEQLTLNLSSVEYWSSVLSDTTELNWTEYGRSVALVSK